MDADDWLTQKWLAKKKMSAKNGFEHQSSQHFNCGMENSLNKKHLCSFFSYDSYGTRWIIDLLGFALKTRERERERM